MSARPIILFALADSARADRLADAMEAEGRFMPTLDAVTEGIDISVTDADGVLHIFAGVPGDGASATLSPEADDALVSAAVALVAAGYRVSPYDHAHDDNPIEIEEPEPSPLKATLSAREMEVLNLLADGAQNKVIARALDISVHTAKFHVASLLTKLGASNRTDAIAIAMREGLVSM
jgi:DNA-binding NarL/FixJ family response regulator